MQYIAFNVKRNTAETVFKKVCTTDMNLLSYCDSGSEVEQFTLPAHASAPQITEWVAITKGCSVADVTVDELIVDIGLMIERASMPEEEPEDEEEDDDFNPGVEPGMFATLPPDWKFQQFEMNFDQAEAYASVLAALKARQAELEECIGRTENLLTVAARVEASKMGFFTRDELPVEKPSHSKHWLFN